MSPWEATGAAFGCQLPLRTKRRDVGLGQHHYHGIPHRASGQADSQAGECTVSQAGESGAGAGQLGQTGLLWRPDRQA